MEERQKRAIRNRKVLSAAIALVLLSGVGALVYASVPHTFTAGETLTADSLNGNFAALDQRMAALESLVPAGTIIAWGGPAVATVADGGAPAVPAGWLLCDGSAVSRTTYASLFAAIGINFGGGDGIGTFNLPDLRGRFLRGVDRGAGRDPSASARTASAAGGPAGDAVGTLEADLLGSHQHTLTDPGHTHSSGSVGGFMVWGCTTNTGLGTASGGNWSTNSNCPGNTSGVLGGGAAVTATTGITQAAAGGAETRPKNVAVNYLIKL